MKQDHKTHYSHLFLLGQKSGQAVVEYILIIAVTLSLIIGLKNTFSQAGKFFENYIGAYTECLMDYGELPSFGVSDKDMKQHLSAGRKCEVKFEKFSLSEGRSLKSNPGGGSNLAAAQSENSSANSGSTSDNSRSQSNQSNSSGGSSGGGSGGSDNRIRNARSVSRTSDGGSNANGKVKTIENEESGDEGSGSSGSRQSRTIYRDRNKYKAVTGQLAEQILKSDKGIPKREPGSRTIAKADDSSGNGIGPRVSIVPGPQEKVVQLEEDKPADWGFGNFLKWILIAGMIIAIVIFFGGQIMNYSNSDST